MISAKELVDNTISLMVKGRWKHERDEDTGQLVFQTSQDTSEEFPWRYFSHDERIDCVLWNNIFFALLVAHNKEISYIHSGCHNCYKVVVRHRNWKEFRETEETLMELGFHGKIGVEKRLWVKGLYGAYIYCRGLEEGRERYSKVRAIIPSDIPVILKRGCTEMEFAVGPSDKWEIVPEQIEVEQELKKRVRVNVIKKDQDEEDIKRIYAYWHKFAYKHDLTYDGKDLYPQYVTYHP